MNFHRTRSIEVDHYVWTKVIDQKIRIKNSINDDPFSVGITRVKWEGLTLER